MRIEVLFCLPGNYVADNALMWIEYEKKKLLKGNVFRYFFEGYKSDLYIVTEQPSIVDGDVFVPNAPYRFPL